MRSLYNSLKNNLKEADNVVYRTTADIDGTTVKFIVYDNGDSFNVTVMANYENQDEYCGDFPTLKAARDYIDKLKNSGSGEDESLYYVNYIKEAEVEVTDEIKPVDHFIERGSVHIPVRKGETDDEVLKHLEKLGNTLAFEPTEEEKASGKYIQELVYSNPQQSGGLCWFEWVKNPDYVEPTEEVKESEVKLNADGVREDATDVLVDGYKKSLQRSFDNIHTLQELSLILRKASDDIDMRLYDEEDTNIQAMDVVKAFEKKSYKTMKDYQEALNDISAMEWDNKISREAYEEYIARLQKAYNERKYR